LRVDAIINVIALVFICFEIIYSKHKYEQFSFSERYR